MSGLDNCPHCGVSLIGDPIPEKDRHHFGKETHFRREVGIEIWGAYDGILYWQCPDCGGSWHRWPVESWQHERAKEFVTKSKK